jgi:hypothetical protein
MLVLTGVAISTFGRAVARLERPTSTSHFLRSPLPWVLLTIYALIGLAYYAIPPVAFPRVVLATTAGERIGGYLAAGAGGTYVVTCTSLADATSIGERIVLVPAATIERTTLGGEPDRLDSGERPSLAALAFRALDIDAHPPTLIRADLRARRATCAGAGPEIVSRGTLALELGAGAIAGRAPPGGRARDGEAPIEQDKTTPPAVAALARALQPTLEVTVADRNWPVSVGAVLHDVAPNGTRTCLHRVGVTQPRCPPTEADLAPVGSTRDDYLQYPAPLSNDPTGQFQAFEAGQSVITGSLHHWLADPGVLDPWGTAQIYFYYAGPVPAGFPRWPVRDANVPSGLIDLEYWFFYPYNYYPTVVGAELMDGAPLAGDIANTDLHQGDWEHVAVLVDQATLKPVWLYMARHSNEGRFLPWDSPELAFDGTHPIVQAAFGGHPSYPSRCGANSRGALAHLSSDWIVCGSGRFAFRAATTPLVDLASVRWACWKGHFGVATPSEIAHAGKNEDSVQRVIDKFYDVAGPQSPLWQAENGSLDTGAGACKVGPEAAELAAPIGLRGQKITPVLGRRP